MINPPLLVVSFKQTSDPWGSFHFSSPGPDHSHRTRATSSAGCEPTWRTTTYLTP